MSHPKPPKDLRDACQGAAGAVGQRAGAKMVAEAGGTGAAIPALAKPQMTPHPSLVALVRLLARQAAADDLASQRAQLDGE